MCNPNRPPLYRQSGASLLELMVGITIGLLVVVVALGTVMSVHLSKLGTTQASDLSQQLHQAVRVISQSIRNAGARELLTLPATGKVQFSDQLTGIGGQARVMVMGSEGGAMPDTLTVAQEARSGVVRGCSGGAELPGTLSLTSTFALVGTNLQCTDTANPSQATVLATSILDFQLRYMVMQGNGQVQWLDAATVTSQTPAAWPSVKAVELCLHMVGTQKGGNSSGTLLGCKGQTVARNGQIHHVLRTTVAVRTANL